MALLQVATETGRAPSEVAGVTCPYCAYCFDEALFFRRALHDQAERKKQEADADIARHQRLMRGR